MLYQDGEVRQREKDEYSKKKGMLSDWKSEGKVGEAYKRPTKSAASGKEGPLKVPSHH